MCGYQAASCCCVCRSQLTSILPHDHWVCCSASCKQTQHRQVYKSGRARWVRNTSMTHQSWCEGHADAKVRDLDQVCCKLVGPIQGLGNEQVVGLDVAVHHTPAAFTQDRAGDYVSCKDTQL